MDGVEVEPVTHSNRLGRWMWSVSPPVWGLLSAIARCWALYDHRSYAEIPIRIGKLCVASAVSP